MNLNFIGKVLSFVLSILIIVAVIGFVVKFAKKYLDQPDPFSVTIGEQETSNTLRGYAMSRYEPTTIQISYPEKEEVGLTDLDYKIKVIPNKEKACEFDFTADQELYSYRSIPDLTKGFIIEKGDDSFTIQPKGSIKEILSSVLGGKNIVGVDGRDIEDMFILEISSADEVHKVTIYFYSDSTPSDVSLDKEAIVF